MTTAAFLQCESGGFRAERRGGGTGDAQDFAVVAGHDRTLDDDDVLALSSLDGLLTGFLEGVAGGSGKGSRRS